MSNVKIIKYCRHVLTVKTVYVDVKRIVKSRLSTIQSNFTNGNGFPFAFHNVCIVKVERSCKTNNKIALSISCCS